ncbi:hypothetical protein C7S16_4638 [Burkholderia thailandensis]|uniref:Uncharacterized protein n=1 Tax=Burkholderia thailandensis TaxID=57975 RepID=A0AAW9CSZ9_BURTH|nr:hypothetical protein [Burkholderia thailandensis]MDW9253522.1 hypothetical protein [Burkholderia thailandensis]
MQFEQRDHFRFAELSGRINLADKSIAIFFLFTRHNEDS